VTPVETAAARVANLSPEKRALLLQQLAKEKQAKGRIGRRPRPEVISPSFAQQRLWVLDQLDPGSPNYNIPMAAWMRGRLDLDVLRRAWNEILRRHESLRTTLPSSEGQPRQVVNELTIDIPVTELPDREAALTFAHTEARKPFDLAKGPLVRVVLARVAEDEHLLVLNFHHAVVDGWSLSIVFKELTELYTAFLEGRPSPLPELPIQYVDYSLWQREWMQGDTLKTQLAWWAERMAGSPPVLELPTDRPRPSVQSYRGNTLKISMGRELLGTAMQRSRDECVTLFMTFLAAMQTLLFRYSGQSDIVVGAGIAGRNRPEIEPLVGYFVNTLALRTDLSGNPTFRELIGRVKEVTLGAYANQELPVEKLIEELHIERSLSHTPLFQTMIFFQNLPAQEWDLPGIHFVPLWMDELHAGTARCDLALFVNYDDQGIDLVFEYATDLFDEVTVRAFGRHLTTLLEAAVKNPETRIGDLPLLSDEERHTLLHERLGVEKATPEGLTLHGLFEAQAARTPDRPALTFETRSLTYRELNTRANAFAVDLQQRGITRGDLVGIRTERGLGMVVALLGVLKAGAAYVPLDPSYPADRIAFMIEASGAKLVIDDVDVNTEPVEGQSPLPVVSPNDAAYVIFTSGSTGKPKGVQIPHAGAVNFLLAMQEEPGITADDVVCAITTLSFDISVLELLLPLTVGARAVIGDRATAMDGKRLARLVAESGVTILQATPASWRMLLDAGWNGDGKIKILCGGEPLPRDLADSLLTRVGELWNVYGPTETTVWSTADRVLPGDAITIGRPIRNMRMYVVDANMQLVPDGVPGELLIGGIGMAHGYVGRPDLTADRFIADPFSSAPSGDSSARLYRTGDVARWRRDGRLEVLGRSDNQIKLRGFRIELGEIEGALREHPAVRQAVVLCREDRPGDKRLVAYVVGETAELRAHLKAMLPEYMVPSAFVSMETLPISPNGKVDRRALPAPELSDLAQTASVAPRTPEEEQLARFWAEVLGLERVGIEDDFFALGGHSLLATQLLARVGKAFGVDVPLRRLFEAPTVAAFAEALAADQLAQLMGHMENLSEEQLAALLGEGA
jgi:amino acid adenylation domain-containing protein